MAVVLAKEQLLLPAIRADPDLFDLLEQVCREKVQSWVSPENVRARAEAVLLELLPYGTPSLDRVARRLGTSARSLSRRLAEEGTNFKEIVEKLKEAVKKNDEERKKIHAEELREAKERNEQAIAELKKKHEAEIDCLLMPSMN